MRRGKEEYQKVYDKIAEEMEQEGYDGGLDGLGSFLLHKIGRIGMSLVLTIS